MHVRCKPIDDEIGDLSELNFALENLLLIQKLGWPMGYFLGRGYFN